MRRRRSDELPRFSSEPSDPLAFSFRWRRRHTLYLVGVVFVLYMFYPRRTRDDGSTLRVDWSKYAYSLYATDSATLCHAVLVFDALAKHGSRAERVLFYPRQWDTVVSDSKDRDSQLLVMARDRYKVHLEPVQLLGVEGRTTDAWTGTWSKSVTKFLAFTLTPYKRVIALDSDITLLDSLDELFLLPPTPMAMPRAYWYGEKPQPLTSLLMVLQPSMPEFERFKETISEGGDPAVVGRNRFDMELVNERFEDSALVLPHRPYALLTGEFRKSNHSAYLGNTFETWDADRVLKEAKLVHFSDWPLPKPWIMWPAEGVAEMQPDCGGNKDVVCAERRVWKGLYKDFRARRKDICRLLSVPAPDWHKIKGGEVHKESLHAAEGTEHEAPHAGEGTAVGSKPAAGEQTVVQ